LSFVFSGLAFYNFWRQRHSFAAGLQWQKSTFTMRRYLRAMLATLVIAIWDTAVIILVVVFTFRGSGSLRPYTSWADVHFDFSRVDQYPTLFIPATVLTQMYFMWWTVPVSAYSFFCFFALCEDAVAEYRCVLRLVPCIRRGSQPKPDPSSSSITSERHLSLPQWTTTATATSATLIDTVIDIKPD
jgi:pheromone a factor receptor